MFILEGLQIAFGITIILVNATILACLRHIQRHLVSAWSNIVILVLIGLVLGALGIYEINNFVKTGTSYSFILILVALTGSCITLFITKASWRRYRFIFTLNILFILLCVGFEIASLILSIW